MRVWANAILHAVLVVGMAISAGAEPNGPKSGSCANPKESALAVVDAYMQTFNARDGAAHAATLNYPSYRFDVEGAVQSWNDAAEYAKSVTDGWSKLPWATTRYDEKNVIQWSDRKVHVAVRFSRYDESGAKLATHDSLYIVTCRGHWGIAFRSSMVPTQGP